ncbi:MAG: hemolysin family protein [Candidatus Devosia euplotis]|nr:hemolysin family protein [Candidatus Devosia euplotis]
MNDTDSLGPSAPPPKSEPLSSPASVPARGPSIWNRIKAMLARSTVSLRDDLQVALDEQGSAETADFSESERTILQNVLKLSNVSVGDVMVERSDIQAIEADCNLGDLLARFRTVGHSRLPVFDDGLDDILGFIHVKDALSKIAAPVDDPAKPALVRLASSVLKQKLGKFDFVRTAMFVPTFMPVGDLLQSMRASRAHMAIVVDEYGGTDGLVTIEDLLEAVVGEIEDEHDELAASLIRKVGRDTYIADARAELSDVQALIGPEFDPGEYADEVDTIGGLIFDLAGHVPKRGERVTNLAVFDFEVLAADSRRIKRVRIVHKRDAGQLAITDQRGQEQKAAAE